MSCASSIPADLRQILQIIMLQYQGFPIAHHITRLLRIRGNRLISFPRTSMATTTAHHPPVSYADLINSRLNKCHDKLLPTGMYLPNLAKSMEWYTMEGTGVSYLIWADDAPARHQPLEPLHPANFPPPAEPIMILKVHFFVLEAIQPY